MFGQDFRGDGYVWNEGEGRSRSKGEGGLMFVQLPLLLLPSPLLLFTGPFVHSRVSDDAQSIGLGFLLSL